METHNEARILSLVHPTYRDNAGTPEGGDDRDFEGVKKLLATNFRQVPKIRYRIEYQSIEIRGREAYADVYIDATFVYEAPNTLPRWRRVTDYHRFSLIKEGNRWLFIRGL